MSLLYADTSFLFSLYGHDANSKAARTCVRKLGAPLCITQLGRYELGNAIRFAAWRKLVTAKEADRALDAVDADVSRRFLWPTACDLGKAVEQAGLLSATYTLKGGHRSFDVLHVASALVLEVQMFLSFDVNQRRLAAKARLSVGP